MAEADCVECGNSNPAKLRLSSPPSHRVCVNATSRLMVLHRHVAAARVQRVVSSGTQDPSEADMAAAAVRRDGYTVLKGVLPRELVDALAK